MNATKSTEGEMNSPMNVTGSEEEADEMPSSASSYCVCDECYSAAAYEISLGERGHQSEGKKQKGNS